MKLFLNIFFATISALSFSQNQAFIYQDSIFLNINGYEEKYARLENDRKTYEQEIKTLQTGLQQKMEVLMKAYQKKESETIEQLKQRMNATDLEKLRFLEEDNKSIDARIVSYNKLLQTQYNTDILPYIELMNKTIESYAKKNKLDFIWTMESVKSQLIYANKGKNITGIIIQEINKSLGN